MDLVPSSSAAHGITWSQNVAHDVAERIAALRSASVRSRVAAWTSVAAPALATAGLAAASAWGAALVAGYVGLLVAPIGVGVHLVRRLATKHAERLDRQRDVSWASQRDGLIFFGDGGLFIERRGGFKPYGVEGRRYHHVELRDGQLVIHGSDPATGATYSLDVHVPDGWTDDDTARVAQKIARFPLLLR